jgi:hypothetical protein
VQEKDAMEPADDLLTIGEVFRELRQDFPHLRPHSLNYAIDSYRIDPARRIGVVRVWSRAQLTQIRSAVARIAGRKAVTA